MSSSSSSLSSSGSSPASSSSSPSKQVVQGSTKREGNTFLYDVTYPAKFLAKELVHSISYFNKRRLALSSLKNKGDSAASSRTQSSSANSPGSLQVVVVGGSFAGIAAATRVATMLPHCSVVLVEPKDYTEYTPGILRAFVDGDSDSASDGNAVRKSDHTLNACLRPLLPSAPNVTVLRAAAVAVTSNGTALTVTPVLPHTLTPAQNNDSSNGASAIDALVTAFARTVTALGGSALSSGNSKANADNASASASASASESTTKSGGVALFSLPFDYAVLCIGSSYGNLIKPSLPFTLNKNNNNNGTSTSNARTNSADKTATKTSTTSTNTDTENASADADAIDTSTAVFVLSNGFTSFLSSPSLSLSGRKAELRAFADRLHRSEKHLQSKYPSFSSPNASNSKKASTSANSANNDNNDNSESNGDLITTVTIVGGGLVGVELAGEIAARYPLLSQRTTLHTNTPTLLPTLPPPAQRRAEAMLTRAGITVKVNSSFDVRGHLARAKTCRNASKSQEEAASGSNELECVCECKCGESENNNKNETSSKCQCKCLGGTEWFVPCLGVSPSPFLLKPHDDGNSEEFKPPGAFFDARGFISCRGTLQTEMFDNIFVAGDMSAPPKELALVKMAYSAEVEGRVAAENIIKLINNNKNLITNKSHNNVAAGSLSHVELETSPACVVGGDSLPSVCCVSLGPRDGSVIVDGVTVSGLVAVAAKQIMEVSKVAAVSSVLWGEALWLFADSAVATMHLVVELGGKRGKGAAAVAAATVVVVPLVVVCLFVKALTSSCGL